MATLQEDRKVSQGEHPDYVEPCPAAGHREPAEKTDGPAGTKSPTSHSGEVGIVPPQSNGAQRPLAQVVVYRQVSALQVALQRRPVIQGIADRLTQRRLRQSQRFLPAQPFLQLVEDRFRLLLAHLLALLFSL